MKNEIEYIEQNLEQLEVRLPQTYKVLDDLAEIQEHFKELAITYQKLKEKIEKVNEFQVEEFRQTLSNVQEEFETAHHHLRTDLNSQIINLNKKVEECLIVSQAQATIPPRVDELKTELRRVSGTVNRLSDQVPAETKQRLEKAEATLRSLGRRVRMMQIFVGILLLGMAALILYKR